MTRTLVLVLVAGASLQAQQARIILPSEERDSVRWTSLGFERVLNTFLWNGRLKYERTSGGIDVQTDQSVRSRLIRADQRSIQDEFNSNVSLTAPLAGIWSLRTQLISKVLSDTRLLDLSQLAQHQGLVGFVVGRPSGLVATALGGYEYNGQGDERDGGFSYLAGVMANNMRLEAFHADILARSSQSFIQPRRQRDDSLVVALHRTFGEGASNELSVRLNNQRREFYVAADSGVQKTFGVRNNMFRREAQVLDLANALTVATSENVRLTLKGGLSTRTIMRRTEYKEFTGLSNRTLDSQVDETQLSGTLEAAYRVPKFVEGQVELVYREREERHTVIAGDAPLDLVQRQDMAARRLGNVSRQTVIRSFQAFTLSDRDQLNLVGSASILRYDTPDTLNTDDRDELLLMFGVEGRHTASRYLRVTVSADVILNHLVYLHRLQSANNYWNRIVRFSTKAEYAPVSWLRTTNSAEVLGNYTVYDFEDHVASVHSFSFRQASWSDSTVVQFTPRLEGRFVGGVRIYERGILRWSDFKERPQNVFVEYSYWPHLAVQVGRSLRMGLGFRGFVQERYRWETGSRVFEAELETSGPTATVEWEIPGLSQIDVRGWREHQQENGKTIRTISHLVVAMRVAF